MTVMAQSDYTDHDTGIKYQYITDNEGTRATLVDGKNFSEWKVTIPKSIPGPSSGTVPVTSIGDEAFMDNKDIKYVKFEYGNNVTTIGKEAFKNCSNLQLIDLPRSLASIGNNAFTGCGRLVHVRCENNTPQEFILKNFPNTLNNNNYATLYVPSAEAKSAYSSVTDWKNIFGDRIYAIVEQCNKSILHRASINVEKHWCVWHFAFETYATFCNCVLVVVGRNGQRLSA